MIRIETAVAFGVALTLVTACDGGGDESLAQQAEELCESYVEASCDRALECDPALSEFLPLLGVSNCDQLASLTCEESGEDPGEGDTCEPEALPTESMINACISSLESVECEDIEDPLEGDGIETPECDAVLALLECEEDEESDGGIGEMDGGGDLPDDDAGFTGVDASGVVVDTTGCMAAVEQMCDAWAACPGAPGDNCPTYYGNNEASIMTACTEYLQYGVATSVPLACWLNEQTASSIEACLDFECATGGYATAAAAYLADPSDENLEALLELVLENCDLSGAVCS